MEIYGKVVFDDEGSILRALLQQLLVKLFMAFTMVAPLRLCFSTFKKKVNPLRTTGLKSPQQLYSSLSAFQAQLSQLQLKKMPKTLQTFGRKFRRLLRQQQKKTIDVEMQLSQTFEAYTRNVDELIFGTQQQQLQTTLEQMRELTSQMAKFDIDPYLKELIPKSQSHRTLYQRFLERFINVEERVCRQMFKGYFGFSRNVSKVAFLEQREYKGDFQFQLVDSLQTIQRGVDVMYHCALFNKLRDKLALACQLAITKLSSKLSDASVGKLLFCLANSGRSLKFIEENYYEIRERMQNAGFSFELLYYMMMAGMQDQILFQMMSNKLVLTPKDAHQQSIALMMKLILGERNGCQIQVEQREQFKRSGEKHEGQIFFQNFLQRYAYEYTSTPLGLFPYNLYTIQGKNFIVYDSFSVKDESFALGGAGLIITQYFLNRSQSVKHINWPRMLPMEKRGERDEYVLSKFKGIERPKRVKVRYYQ